MDKNSLTEWPYSKIWWLLASVIAAGIILGMGTIEIFPLIALPLAVFIFGFTLAATLATLVSWLEKWMPRLVAMILVYLAMLALLAGLIWLIIPPLTNQVQDFATYIPSVTDRITGYINQLRGNIPGESLTSTLLSQLSSLGSVLLRLPVTIISALSGIILILFVSFYMLLEANGILEFILSLFPGSQASRVRQVISDMAQSMGGYVRGSAITGLITGSLTFLGLQILGINFALTFGVMTGLLELIPVAGPIIAGLIISGLTLVQSPWKALYALILMVVLQQTENHILVPNIMRNQTNVSPLLSILALFAGAAIGGLIGALIAIPIAGALRVLVIQVIAPAIRSRAGAEEQGVEK